ncbi:MAG TPA: tRNA uridine-5-carboxymethylaminomethyl(34) synthesis enzyme MnmG [Erysipelotrichaceae bacterium]|nr:tRNA uridine-5-carboxymethylaminomethyl(34) synthesis enzyme MnmG [Erysipelotrichaceae bacterium]HQA85240.1 tRNA uridine-5-carboxymethylaminomethyl(34) synthesis enzyme MnmG [Erysipelotrichaceae bacterium]
MVDVIVVGAGHAGCEAALATSRLGFNTVLCTIDKNFTASLPCNPSIGGPAKGVVVREIDALGGQMAKIADETALQLKMLNTTKGPGVRSLRIQADKILYKKRMLEVLEKQKNLTLKECMVEDIIVKDNIVKGVSTETGEVIESKIVILTTGTFMNSKIMVSNHITFQGPDNLRTSKNLSQKLKDLGFRIFRLKTGTPARIKTDSIDFSCATLEPGNTETEAFSFETEKVLPLKEQVPCYLIYTQPETHQIIQENLHKSSMYSGVVEGIGTRYCPSVEDKIVRFADKERHQIFLEPESLSLDTTYVQGFSTSMPYDVQDRMLYSLPGFKNHVVDKYAYAIEYDAIDPLQLKPSLETKVVENLFCAGQINGTSGYEEAAGQGLMAGINAINKLKGKQPLILRRDEAYIGVMIDDLVTKGTKEPYRLLTSRAEYRLLLRHDNADQRLTNYGYEAGLISEERYQKFVSKVKQLEYYKQLLKETKVNNSPQLLDYLIKKGYEDNKNQGNCLDLIKRPNVETKTICQLHDIEIDEKLANQLDIEIKFEGYISKTRREAANLIRLEKQPLPYDLDYDKIVNLSIEAKEKLLKVRPLTIGQASRISGVNPADIITIQIYLKQSKTV